jgi:hypothetical protein
LASLDKQSIADLTSNLVVVVVLILLGFLSFKMTTMTVQERIL